MRAIRAAAQIRMEINPKKMTVNRPDPRPSTRGPGGFSSRSSRVTVAAAAATAPASTNTARAAEDQEETGEDREAAARRGRWRTTRCATIASAKPR